MKDRADGFEKAFIVGSSVEILAGILQKKNPDRKVRMYIDSISDN